LNFLKINWRFKIKTGL